MQMCLGTVYAWSVFKGPLMQAHGWAQMPTQITFMICIGVIGIAAAFGVVLMLVSAAALGVGARVGR